MAHSENLIQQVNVGGTVYDIHDKEALHSISDAHGPQGPQSTEGLYTIQTDGYGHTKTVHNVIGSHTGTNEYAVQLDTSKHAYVKVPWTDEHVTSAANHYDPATGTQSWIPDSYTTGTAVTWSNPVVTGVNVKKDAKGHVTGVQVVTGTLPATPPNDNTWRNVQINGTEQLGTATSTGALNIKNGTHTTVSYDGGVKVSHNAPGAATLSAETTQGTVGTYKLNTEYTVVTGVQIAKDNLGHVTGVQVTKQKVKDTDTTYTAAHGVQVNGTKISHTNSVTAKTEGFYKVAYDAQGHITSSSAVTGNDIVNLVADGGKSIAGLQTTVEKLMAELDDPTGSGGLVESFLDQANTMLNAKSNAVTGVQGQLYGLQVNNNILSLVFDGTKVNTKQFVTGATS